MQKESSEDSSSDTEPLLGLSLQMSCECERKDGSTVRWGRVRGHRVYCCNLHSFLGVDERAESEDWGEIWRRSGDFAFARGTLIGEAIFGRKNKAEVIIFSMLLSSGSGFPSWPKTLAISGLVD